MNNSFGPALVAIGTAAILAVHGAGADVSGELSKEDREALAIGRAVLKLHELGRAGAPFLPDAEKAELEHNVRFLSKTSANRMTWAWLQFRHRNDQSLKLQNNPGAKAIRQRLDLFPTLIRRYFAFE